MWESAYQDEETGGTENDPRCNVVVNDMDIHRELRMRQRRKSSLRRQATFEMRSYYLDLIQPKLPDFWKKTTHVICFIVLPLLLIAIILYYGVEAIR